MSFFKVFHKILKLYFLNQSVCVNIYIFISSNLNPLFPLHHNRSANHIL